MKAALKGRGGKKMECTVVKHEFVLLHAKRAQTGSNDICVRRLVVARGDPLDVVQETAGGKRVSTQHSNERAIIKIKQ